VDKAFIKGLRLIEALAASESPRGVTELAHELQMTKSNVHRLLTTLQREGYVRQTAALGSYEMTPRLWEYGCRVMARFDLARYGREAMRQLSEATRETVLLSILDELDVVYLDKIEGAHDVRAYSRIGGRAPAWCVATGKAMLAYAPAEALAGVEARLHPHTARSIATRAELDIELAAVRRQRYAVNAGEWRAGVCGVAAPVFNGAGAVVGAIGVSGPAQRLHPRQIKKLAGHVLDAADTLALALGQRAVPGRLMLEEPRRAERVTAMATPA
jgi:DNA-binding IclR family transcriptional regulator